MKNFKINEFFLFSYAFKYLFIFLKYRMKDIYLQIYDFQLKKDHS